MGKLGNGGSHCQNFGRVPGKKMFKGAIILPTNCRATSSRRPLCVFQSNASSLGRTKMVAKLASMLRVVPPFRWVCHHVFSFVFSSLQTKTSAAEEMLAPPVQRVSMTSLKKICDE